MKRNTLHLLVIATLSFHTAAFAQGSLTPPIGAPTPVMKSLDQIEPRTPISSVPFTITKPGSYYFTTNLAVSSGTGITIATNNVALDLNGFSLTSNETYSLGYGIQIKADLRNISIENGFIMGGVTNNGSDVYSGPGFSIGIYSIYPNAKNVRVARVALSNCKQYGISVGASSSSIVESCHVTTIGSVGIFAEEVMNSAAIDCGSKGIEAETVLHCRGEASGAGTGIDATVVSHSQGISVTGTGIKATTVENCYGNGNVGHGIIAVTVNNSVGNSNDAGNGIQSTGAVTGSRAYSRSGTGLIAVVANNCVVQKGSGGRAIQATVANGCYNIGGTNLITYKYNMP